MIANQKLKLLEKIDNRLIDQRGKNSDLQGTIGQLKNDYATLEGEK